MATQTKSPPDAAAEATPGARAWSEALCNPQLHDLPFKIETNARGQLVLSPQKIYHSISQSRTLKLLEKHVRAQGEATVEFALYTADGVKVPDVVWISDERAGQIPEDAEASPVMPEICVEVLYRSNTQAEMEEKRRLFFEGGAEEVWIVDPEGGIVFYEASGPLEPRTWHRTFRRRWKHKVRPVTQVQRGKQALL